MVAMKAHPLVALWAATRDASTELRSVDNSDFLTAAKLAGQMAGRSVVYWACCSAVQMVRWRVVTWVASTVDSKVQRLVGDLAVPNVFISLFDPSSVYRKGWHLFSGTSTVGTSEMMSNERPS
jgi:hypothetical protein